MNLNRISSLALALAIVALAAAPAAAVVPTFVADINPRFGSTGSDPQRFVRVGGRILFIAGPLGSLWSTNGTSQPVALGPADLEVSTSFFVALGRAFFTACRENSGCGLWASDGTPTGTRQLAASPLGSGLDLVRPPGSNRVFLSFNDGRRGAELWSSDGTPAGTRLAVDLNSSASGSRPRSLVWFRGKLWFVADNRNGSRGLFLSDGTRLGTKRVGTFQEISGLAVLGSRLAFFARSGGSTIDLWSSDGSLAGTRKIADVPFSFDPPSAFVAAGGRGYFFTFVDSRRHLWSTDGTPGGTAVLASSEGFDIDLRITALGAKVAFLALSAQGRALWTSDGSAAGTKVVREICSGDCEDGMFQLGPAAAGRVWFLGSNPAEDTALWTSDLTPQGTRLLREVCTTSCAGQPATFLPSASKMYFTAGRFESRHLWSSDGTSAGTRVLLPLPVGLSDVPGVAFGAGSLVFTGYDPMHGLEPWVSNGTAVGTRRLGDLNSDNLVGSNPVPIGSAGGRGYFLASDGEHGLELWSSDGTEAGTRLAYDRIPGPASGFGVGASEIITSDVGGRLVMFFSNGNGNYHLEASDGTPAGSGKLLASGIFASGLGKKAGGRLFFVATDTVHGAELWATNGTAAGTLRLTDFGPADPFRPEEVTPRLIALRDRLVAPVLSSAGVEEFWISDGTPTGTKPLAAVYPFLVQPLRDVSGDPVDLGSQILFVTGENSDADTLVWRTDLTSAGTALVGPLEPADLSAREFASFALNGRMLIFGRSVAFGNTLWVSDGTAAGTRPVQSVSFSSRIEPVVANGRLFFLVGSDLWASDGTGPGTDIVVSQIGNSFRAESLNVLGEVVVFSDDSDFGGFWESDGTPQGTRSVQFPPAVRLDNSPRVTGTGSKVFFAASESIHGRELWALEP